MIDRPACPRLDEAARAARRCRRADRRLLWWTRLADATDRVPVLGRLALWRWGRATAEADRAWADLGRIERAMRRARRHDAADALRRVARGGRGWDGSPHP